MNQKALMEILQQVADGFLPVTAAQKKLANLALEDIDYAHIDHHRSLRKGFPEVIYGEGKTTEQIIGIMEKMSLQEQVILVTRVDQHKSEAILSRFAEASYEKDARMVVYQKGPVRVTGRGTVVIITAGT